MTSESFEIVIKGTLSEPVADLIDGFEISTVEHGETHLIGVVPDQTKLQGILTIFGNLNIELVSVNPVAGKKPVAGKNPVPGKNPVSGT